MSGSLSFSSSSVAALTGIYLYASFAIFNSFWPVSWFAINRKAIMQWNSRGSHRIVSCSQVELRIPCRQMSFKKRAWSEALCVSGLDHTSFCLCRKFTYTFIVLSTCVIERDKGHDPVVGVTCQNTVDWTCFVINVSGV
jgi:hypothetical protein